MNYIWDLIIRAEEQGVRQEELIFKPQNPISPYEELGFENMNQSVLTDLAVEVNGIYRYAAIFERLLEERMGRYPELRELLFDILMHYLAQLDLRQGLCRQEYYQMFLCEDMNDGRFGNQSAIVFGSFSKEQRRQILLHILRLYELGPSRSLLRSAMKSVFPHSISYALVENGRQEFLLYVGFPETDILKKQVDFMCSLFVPFDYQIRLFWDIHFGIVGIEETMEIDNFIVD